MSTVDREQPYREPDTSLAEGEEAPPRGVRLMAGVRWAMLAGMIALAAFSWWSYARAERTPEAGSAAHQHAPKYQCPMHPQIVSDEPGECPICHMALEPIASERAASPAPSFTANLPPGTAPLTLSLDRVQAIGVRTSLVEERTLETALRVTAIVAAPDQGAAEVHVRTPGFVEQIFVNQTGVAVGAGQALFAVYSPELYTAQTELLTARQWLAPDAGSNRTLESAKRKLELLGMSAADIAHVLEKAEPMRSVTIHAPAGGYVTKKSVVLGSYVTPEMTLYELQDLSRVYVVADVFQSDMPRIKVGTVGAFIPTGDATRREAKVDLIYPAVNAEARTTRVRMQIKNDGRRLLPGAYGSVQFASSTQKVVVVPRDAVVDTGHATYVFVVEGEGRYVPRTVALGQGQGDVVVVRDGVKPNERVVSGATFLIDSESRLQASIAAQSAPAASASGSANAPAPAAPPPVHQHGN